MPLATADQQLQSRPLLPGPDVYTRISTRITTSVTADRTRSLETLHHRTPDLLLRFHFRSSTRWTSELAAKSSRRRFWGTRLDIYTGRGMDNTSSYNKMMQSQTHHSISTSLSTSSTEVTSKDRLTTPFHISSLISFARLN